MKGIPPMLAYTKPKKNIPSRNRAKANNVTVHMLMHNIIDHKVYVIL